MPINVKANNKFVGTWPNTLKEVRVNSANSSFKFTVYNNIATVAITPAAPPPPPPPPAPVPASVAVKGVTNTELTVEIKGDYPKTAKLYVHYSVDFIDLKNPVNEYKENGTHKVPLQFTTNQKHYIEVYFYDSAKPTGQDLIVDVIKVEYTPTIVPVDPPVSQPDGLPTLSAQIAVDMMRQGSESNYLQWGYPPNRNGGSLSVGAGLLHKNLNLYDGSCQNVEPYRSLLATRIIPWLTFAFENPADGQRGLNFALEMVPTTVWGRIKSKYGGPRWEKLLIPTGQIVGSVIASNGVSVGSADPAKAEIGWKLELGNSILHPWAVVNPNTGNGVVGEVRALVQGNPRPGYSDYESKLDNICHSWFVRVVAWDSSAPMRDSPNNRKVILTASADPYVNGPPRVNGLNSGPPLAGEQCVAAIAASKTVYVGTAWKQVSWFCALDAADLHTNLPESGVTSAEWMASHPDEYK